MVRRVNLRETRDKLFIISEGEKTEKKYFRNYRKRGCGLEIKTPNTSRTDPIGLVEFAERQIRKHGLEPEGDDEVWCVFDVDENEEKIHDAVEKARESGIKIALSNPCFEIWYLLHFKFRDTGLTRKDAVNEVRDYLPDYSKNQDIFEEIKDKRQDAISHAEKLNEIHREERNNELYSPDSNPSTQVFRLVRYILDYTECGE